MLGTNLVGIYLYGSVLDPSFVPRRSDLDCLTVTLQEIDSAAFDRLEEWLGNASDRDATFRRIQMSLLIRDRVLQDDPSACLYQFGRLTRSGSDGNPIVWLDFVQRGLVLSGPDPAEFLPSIDAAILHEALVREVGYLREEISTKAKSTWRDQESYQAYAVLTLCRILYSLATGQVTSKAAAAEWAIQNTPGATGLHNLIHMAEDISNERLITSIPLPSIERFISYVEGWASSPKGRGPFGRAAHGPR